MSSSHRFSTSTWATVLEFFALVLTVSDKPGAKSSAARQSIHLSRQNRILLPLPTEMLTRLSNTCRASKSLYIGRPCHGRLSSVLLSHSHRTRSANSWVLRHLTPRPPYSKGLQTRFHATKHCPPAALAAWSSLGRLLQTRMPRTMVAWSVIHKAHEYS
jgi:hypothetical protein